MNSSRDDLIVGYETEQPIAGHFFTKGDTPPLHTGVVVPGEEWAESLG
jgi:hypothetical protein